MKKTKIRLSQGFIWISNCADEISFASKRSSFNITPIPMTIILKTREAAEGKAALEALAGAGIRHSSWLEQADGVRLSELPEGARPGSIFFVIATDDDLAPKAQATIAHLPVQKKRETTIWDYFHFKMSLGRRFTYAALIVLALTYLWREAAYWIHRLFQ